MIFTSKSQAPNGVSFMQILQIHLPRTRVPGCKQKEEPDWNSNCHEGEGEIIIGHVETGGGSSALNGTDLVDSGSRGKKQQELIRCQSRSLNLCGGKGTGTEKAAFRGQADPWGRGGPKESWESPRRDPQPLHRLRQNTEMKKRLSEAGSSTETLAVTEVGKCVADAGTTRGTPFRSLRHLPWQVWQFKSMRISPHRERLDATQHITSRCELGLCLTPTLKT